MSGRVLLVDDEPRVLDAFRRALAGRFDVEVAASGDAGLQVQRQALDSGSPFPVIVSDMKMPGMDGAEFLSRARLADPDVVPLILSGQADLDSTISAVNNAGLFAFLVKPCPSEELASVLNRALAHNALVIAERELLERTVRGTADMLNDLMASSRRSAFMRTLRIRDLVSDIAERLGLQRDWELLLASRLSQVGCLAIPDDLLAKAFTGGRLSQEEAALFRSHRATGMAMLERIPRLERIARWIGALPLTVDEAPPADADDVQLVLCAVAAFVTAFEAGEDAAAAAGQLARSGHYPEHLVQAIIAGRAVVLHSAGLPRQVTVAQLREGMELIADVTTRSGMTLVRKGEQVTWPVVERLRNFARTVGVAEPMQVIDYRRGE